jgi:lysophospholipase
LNVKIISGLLILCYGLSDCFAVSENELQSRALEIKLAIESKLVVSKFQGEGHAKIVYATLAGDRSLAPIVISVGLGESFLHYEELLFDFQVQFPRHAVFILDLRGQGLSDRLAHDKSVFHVEEFEHYVKDLEMFFDSVVRESYPLPAKVIGHSTGGLIAYELLMRRPQLAERIVFVTPLFGFHLGGVPQWIPILAARMLAFVGFRERGIPFRESNLSSFETNGLTHSQTRFHRILAVRDRLPFAGIGGPSIGFFLAASDRLKEMTYEFPVPALILGAEEDRYVSNRLAHLVCTKAKSCRYAQIPKAFHVLLQERDEFREQALNLIAEFL